MRAVGEHRTISPKRNAGPRRPTRHRDFFVRLQDWPVAKGRYDEQPLIPERRPPLGLPPAWQAVNSQGIE